MLISEPEIYLYFMILMHSCLFVSFDKGEVSEYFTKPFDWKVKCIAELIHPVIKLKTTRFRQKTFEHILLNTDHS